MNYLAMGSFSANHSAVFPPSHQTREFRQTTVVDRSDLLPYPCLCWYRHTSRRMGEAAEGAGGGTHGQRAFTRHVGATSSPAS